MQPGDRSGRTAVATTAATVLLLLAFLPACEREGPRHPVPSAEEVATYFEYAGGVSVEISGNVAQVSVTIDPAEYARGGSLWAKSFPYLFLFSPGTRDAFREHPGLAGVRVMIFHPGGDIVAQALLERTELTEGLWRRALNVAGRARQEGTARPGLMSELVHFGEDHTDHQYNPDYIANP